MGNREPKKTIINDEGEDVVEGRRGDDDHPEQFLRFNACH
jgi:hypothetical protein